MKNYQNFFKCVNAMLNSRINMAMFHQDDAYLVRHLVAPDGRIRLQPTYSDVFINAHLFIELASKYDYCCFVTIEPNLSGVLSPVLNFYSTES